MTETPQTKPLLPSEVKTGLVGFIAILALLAFVVMYLFIFYYTLQPYGDENAEPPQRLDDAQLLSVSTGLTGLVGGVVAVALAQQQVSGTSGAPSEGAPRWYTAFTRWRWFKWFFDMPPKGRLAALYVLIYLIMGVAAAVVWIISGPEAPDTVKALASVALGLLIPIVRTYFIPGELPPST